MFEGFPGYDEDGNLPDTRVLPLSEKPAGSAADRSEAEAAAGPDSLEERWARLGVFSNGGDDKTRVLPDASPRTDAGERPGTRTGDDVGVPAAPDGPERFGGRADGPGVSGGRMDRQGLSEGWTDGQGPSGGRMDRQERFDGRADSPWDAERTTALRIPRPRAGVPGAQVTPPSSRAGGTRPPGDLGAAGSREDTARFTGPSPTASRTPVRDPWQEPGESVAATHDPHEVTVQLDAVQIGDGGVLRRSPGRAGAGQDAPGGPVFVDESGRRSRLYRRIGMAVGLACAGYAVVMVATLLSGNSDAPWMPVPGQEQKPAGKVESTPQPAETDAVPSSGTSLLPGGTPTTGTTTPPTPGATAPATGAAGTVNQPDAADPTPTSPRIDTTQPATGGDDAAPTIPDETPSSPPPDPPVSDSPAPGTTAPTGDGDAAGADNVAGAPADSSVVAADGSAARPEPSTTPAAPSSENVI
ncbi:hypothetical protein AB0D65_26630 [Streptomyces griseoloalbus]|uniref:Translation initiation factor IF-2 n=1 Tax=Streptomyces griseoloalbus TaxID=67303 RepID=A0ABV3EBC6_9ACTN